MSKTVRLMMHRVIDLVEMAREAHPDGPDQLILIAVLGAWCNLAGVIGWTDEMVRVVEREMRVSG